MRRNSNRKRRPIDKEHMSLNQKISAIGEDRAARIAMRAFLGYSSKEERTLFLEKITTALILRVESFEESTKKLIEENAGLQTMYDILLQKTKRKKKLSRNGKK